MRITQKQLRQIIREELARTVPLSEARKRFTPTPEMIAMRDPVTGYMPHPRDIAAMKAKQAEEDLARDIAGALGPVGEASSEEDEEQAAFDKVYGGVEGFDPAGRRLDPVTEKLVIRAVENASRYALREPAFPLYPNSYDIYEAIGPSGLLNSMQQAALGRDPVAARMASAWLKWLKENEGRADAILHKAVYETLKHAVSTGAIVQEPKRASMRWDIQQFYALPSEEINESRRKKR